MGAVGGRVDVTVSVGAGLGALPAAFVTTARSWAPSSARATDGMEKLADVAPAMLAPLRCHWKASGGVPVALTGTVPLWPMERVWLCGGGVIGGGWLATAGRMRPTVPVPRAR